MVQRHTYSASFKLMVIKSAEVIGNRGASVEYSVDESYVRRWRRIKDKLSKCERSRKSFSGPRTGRHPVIDAAVLSFLTELRTRGLPVTQKAIMSKAQQIANENGVIFKGSRGWCDKFMKRAQLSLRPRTTIGQTMPADFAEQISRYQAYVKTLHKTKKYDTSQIGSAYEIKIYIDMPRSYTVNVEEEKKIMIQTTGNEKKRINVMLCVTADGNKLPPYVILNRKKIPKEEKFCDDVIVRAQQREWMNTDLLADWMESIWERRNGRTEEGSDEPKSLLILDTFRGHLTEEVQSRISAVNSDLIIIPNGLRGQLQSTNGSITQLFETYVQ